MFYEITIPYDIQGEREGKPEEECQAYERWFESEVEFNVGDQIEWGDRLLSVATRRPVISYPTQARKSARPRPHGEIVHHIKLFCMNI